jgi:hypothetical protein
MEFILWSVIALLIGAALVVFGARRTRQLLPAIDLPPGESMSPAPVQRLARRALVAIVLLVALAVSLVVVYGPETWWNDDPLRLTVTGVLLAALVVLLLFNIRVRALATRDEGAFDERDEIILGRSCAGVGGAMMTVMAAWMIGLIESHQPSGMIPSYWLHLVFWSLVMTNVIATMAGIVLSYRRG